VDYGFVPVTDRTTGFLNTMVARRVPTTKLREADHVRGFIKDLNAALALHPADDLLIGTHANSEGQMMVLLYPNQVDYFNRPTDRTEYENLEQTLENTADGLARRIRIDGSLIAWTAPPPTHSLHFRGCNLGKAVPFLTKFKQALGGHVIVKAPKHFQGVVEVGGGKGSFEYMCYEFTVQVKARLLPKGKYQGFDKRADLLKAFGNAGHHYIDGTRVLPAGWESWVPKDDIVTSQSFCVAMKLGCTVAGLNELTIQPNKKKQQKGAREFRVNELRSPWAFAPPASATTYDDRVAELKKEIEKDPRFKATHDWPMFERAGYASLDAYMDGHLWYFGKANAGPITIGRRYEYTVLFPITDAAGNLVFNFYPGPGTTQTEITTGFSTIGLDKFYASV
jgi:hypothetical protein